MTGGDYDEKVHASVSRAWFCTNVRHVCDDERGRDGGGRHIYQRTVRGEIEMPHFSSSSAAIRSSPPGLIRSRHRGGHLLEVRRNPRTPTGARLQTPEQ